MKASEYEIDWSSGPFTCCWEHVENCTIKVKLGDKIECDECGTSMVLERCKDNVIRWRAAR